MGFFSGLGKALGAVVKVAAPVVIAAAAQEALINTAAGAAVKHGMRRVPNNAIPYLNLALSTAVAYGRTVATTGDWTGSIAPALKMGGITMAASTALHQAIKLPLRNLVGGELAVKVGPGTKFSL